MLLHWTNSNDDDGDDDGADDDDDADVMRDSINTINYIMALPVCSDKKKKENEIEQYFFRSLLWLSSDLFFAGEGHW